MRCVNSCKYRIEKLGYWCVLTGLAALVLFAESARSQGTRVDYERSSKLWTTFRGKVTRDRVNAHWTADGNAFWYQSRLAGGSWEYRWVDAIAGTSQVAFDHERLARALAEAAGQPTDTLRLGIDAIEMRPESVVIDRHGKRWAIDKRTYKVTAHAGRAAPPTAPLRLQSLTGSSYSAVETSITFMNLTGEPIMIDRVDLEGTRHSKTVPPDDTVTPLTYVGEVFIVSDAKGATLGIYQATEDAGEVIFDPDAAPATAPATVPATAQATTAPAEQGLSPDGRLIAFVRENNVFVRDLSSGQEHRLSGDSQEESYFYPDSLYWSPDSTRFTITKSLNDGDRPQAHIIQHTPPDQLAPKLISINYWRPGDQLPRYRPHLFDVAAHSEIAFSDDLFPTPWNYVEVRNWSPDSKWFHFWYTERGNQLTRLIAVDAASGDVRCVVEERSKTLVELDKALAWPIYKSEELIWMSERDGWNHLYLIDLKTGELKNQITKGRWVVLPWDDKFDWVDPVTRQIGFRAAGLVEGQDPYYVHHCRVSFDGSGLIDLTPGNGTHSISYSPDKRFCIDTYSRVDAPPVTELRRASDGSLVCALEKGDITDLLATGWRAPEPFVAKGRDATTDIHGVIYRPTNFDPDKRYPIVENIYGAPYGAWVPKAFTIHEDAMELAELGFIVVQIDGMGTNQRSKVFPDICWRNLGDGGFADRIAWIKAAAEKYPYMDLSKGVGIYGSSFGGYLALRALLVHGEFYQVAVSEAGAHDFRLVSFASAEQWMGWPIGPWYEQQSNVTDAHKLNGKLLLVVREMDQTVDPACTMRVVDALIQADKDFDLLVIPNADHDFESPYVARRRKDFLVRHLLGVEPRAK